MTLQASTRGFYGWRVVQGAFALGAFGWGIGFFGPPIFLGATAHAMNGSLALISAAISLHFLIGALTGANLPALHRKLGAAIATQAGALCMFLGLIGWPLCTQPWQLFLATTLTGIGWGTMSAAALNLIVSPWFARMRPLALSAAYNGGSVGGIVFSPLWVAAIGALGFPLAALTIGTVMLFTIWALAARVFARTPQAMGLRPDGEAWSEQSVEVSPPLEALPRARPWRDGRLRLLAAAMTMGLFAQIGLAAHLYSLLTPALGSQGAGWAMALVTVMAIAGRTVAGAKLSAGGDRTLVACAGYIAQFFGSAAFILAGGTDAGWLIAGIVLFGLGFGNATSLPPLIAQCEFAAEDVQRVTALIVGIAQIGYAFAPVTFGLMRELAAHSDATAVTAVFVLAAVVQALAAALFVCLHTKSRARRQAAIAAR